MPRKSAFRTVLLLAALSACVGQAPRAPAPGAAPVAGGSPRGEFQNLQVLPDTISRAALTAVMRGFSSSLGVRCTHCHVPYEGAPPDSLNFASDAREAKQVARGMMRMVRRINGEVMPAIPELGDQRMQVGCVTCHRGAPRPLMLEDTLLTVARAQGADSAVAVYRALRAQHYGGFTYNFGERTLSTLAARLGAEGRQAEARRILELNVEQFPSSAGAAFELGRVLEALGERDRAIAEYRRALTLQPNHRPAQERLRALGQP
ncbi:MAG: c-type cytochrome [Gemmatimonadetes bacterium]|nr:c-type cytochrome [Gemmatimonadota bacterium]